MSLQEILTSLGQKIPIPSARRLDTINIKLTNKEFIVDENVQKAIEAYAQTQGVQTENKSIRYIWSELYSKKGVVKVPEEVKQVATEEDKQITVEKEVVERDIQDKIIILKVSSPLIAYQKRIMTAIKVPKYALNKNGAWISNGISTFYPSCTRCGFYLSTGVSNEANFPGVWFPFLRINTEEKRGWIQKAQTLQNSPSFKKALAKKGIEVKQNSFLYYFFEKFSHWWQVSISAALQTENTLWNVHPDLLAIKTLALTRVFDLVDEVLKRDPSVVKCYKLKDNVVNIVNNPEDVNAWLDKSEALCKRND